MDRTELERLDRATLIARAEAMGVQRADILTRPELVDELLIRNAHLSNRDLPRARGLFGRARDLVARIIEKGLHLPDAADRFRQANVPPARTPGHGTSAVVPTVTLAEIYATQGHTARAVELLRRLLELEPDHEAAATLLTRLESAAEAGGAPPAPSDPEELDARTDEGVSPALAEVPAEVDARDTSTEKPPPPSAPREVRIERLSSPHIHEAIALEPPPPPRPLSSTSLIDLDGDECVALSAPPGNLLVHWAVCEATLEHARRMRPAGDLTLRLLHVTPSLDGPRSTVQDQHLEDPHAVRAVPLATRDAVVRTAVGWKTGDTFVPIAHSALLELPLDALRSDDTGSLTRWTPAGTRPVSSTDRDYPAVCRALKRFARAIFPDPQAQCRPPSEAPHTPRYLSPRPDPEPIAPSPAARCPDP